MSNLMKRAVVSAVFAPLIILAALWVDSRVLLVLLVGAAVISGYEWARICTADRGIAICYSLIVGLTTFVVTMLTVAVITAMVAFAAFIWAVCWIVILRFQSGDRDRKAFNLVAGVLLVPTAFISLWWLYMAGEEYLITLLVMVWTIDTIGYCAGKKWGREKILPAVSPNKTWQGLYGQFGSALLLAFVLHFVLVISPTKALCISLLVTLAAITGDFFESVMKRQNEVKDSGRLLPGHGGLLDRIDGLLAAAPVFWLLLRF